MRQNGRGPGVREPLRLNFGWRSGETNRRLSLIFDFFFEAFADFLKFAQVFQSFRMCADLFGPVRTFSDTFGYVRKRKDAFRCVWPILKNLEDFFSLILDAF